MARTVPFPLLAVVRVSFGAYSTHTAGSCTDRSAYDVTLERATIGADLCASANEVEMPWPPKAVLDCRHAGELLRPLFLALCLKKS